MKDVQPFSFIIHIQTLHKLNVSCGEFGIHFEFSSYLLRNLAATEPSRARTENMLLSAVVQEDILSEKWAVWSGVGMDQLWL